MERTKYAPEFKSEAVKTTQPYAHLSQDTLLAAANSATTPLGAAVMPRVLPVALAA